MSENDAAREAARREVMDHLWALQTRKVLLRKAGMEPSGVVLPGRLNVPYDGDDATDFKAECMGMPVTWSEGEQWGFIVEVTGLDALGVTIGEER